MNGFLKSLKVTFVVFLVSVLGFFIWLSDKHAVPILMYHSIHITEGATGIVVDPQSFAKQMNFLRKNGYRVISLDALVTAIKSNQNPPRNSVVITFDDGNADNYQQAFPQLKKHGFPAIIFVIASTVGQKDYVTWAQLKEMEQFGVTAGSHTLDHVYLPGAAKDVQRHQITESKKVIERNLGHSIDYIAYPSGGFTNDIKAMVQQAGYRGACTTNRGYTTLNRDIYELKRIRLKSNESNISLWMKLSGYYTLFKTPREPN